MRILAISGSLRRESYNRRLLLAARCQLRPAFRVDLWEGLHAVPAFDEDREAGPTPPAVAALRGSIQVADAVLIATPEYNGSIPGALKNALDWASRPYASNGLRGKPVAVIGASPSPRGAKAAQHDLRKVLRVIGAEVVDAELAVASVHQHFDDHGVVRGEQLLNQLREVVTRLVACAGDRSLSMTG
jgi:chromate reductase